MCSWTKQVANLVVDNPLWGFIQDNALNVAN